MDFVPGQRVICLNVDQGDNLITLGKSYIIQDHPAKPDIGKDHVFIITDIGRTMGIYSYRFVDAASYEQSKEYEAEFQKFIADV